MVKDTITLEFPCRFSVRWHVAWRVILCAYLVYCNASEIYYYAYSITPHHITWSHHIALTHHITGSHLHLQHYVPVMSFKRITIRKKSTWCNAWNAVTAFESAELYGGVCIHWTAMSDHLWGSKQPLKLPTWLVQYTLILRAGSACLCVYVDFRGASPV